MLEGCCCRYALGNLIWDIVRWHVYAFGNLCGMLFEILGLEGSAVEGMVVIMLEEHACGDNVVQYV